MKDIQKWNSQEFFNSKQFLSVCRIYNNKKEEYLYKIDFFDYGYDRLVFAIVMACKTHMKINRIDYSDFLKDFAYHLLKSLDDSVSGDSIDDITSNEDIIDNFDSEYNDNQNIIEEDVIQISIVHNEELNEDHFYISVIQNQSDIFYEGLSTLINCHIKNKQIEFNTIIKDISDGLKLQNESEDLLL